MKHKGANMEYAEERLSDLMRTYDEYISSCDYIRMPEVYAYIANAPAARFYVSDNRATIVVSAMLQGKQHIKMRPLKFEMFQEICRRVLSLRELHPEWSLKMLCAEWWHNLRQSSTYHRAVQRLWFVKGEENG